MPAPFLFVGVLWPGDSRWLPVLDYPFEGDIATGAGRMLAPFINSNLGAAGSISLAAHSLGSRVMLETARGLNRRVRRMILMAAAVEDDCLRREFAKAAANVDQISLLASHEDDVLKLAFPGGNLVYDLISPGHPYSTRALGFDGPDDAGPENLRCGWQIADNWNYGHLNYMGGCTGGGGAIRQDVSIPFETDPTPSCKQAWSAAFVSTRFK